MQRYFRPWPRTALLAFGAGFALIFALRAGLHVLPQPQTHALSPTAVSSASASSAEPAAPHLVLQQRPPALYAGCAAPIYIYPLSGHRPLDGDTTRLKGGRLYPDHSTPYRYFVQAQKPGTLELDHLLATNGDTLRLAPVKLSVFPPPAPTPEYRINGDPDTTFVDGDSEIQFRILPHPDFEATHPHEIRYEISHIEILATPGGVCPLKVGRLDFRGQDATDGLTFRLGTLLRERTGSFRIYLKAENVVRVDANGRRHPVKVNNRLAYHTLTYRTKQP
ncbi:MAG: hypothetical protein AAF570_11965 [Bacteroidota bacterium]